MSQLEQALLLKLSHPTIHEDYYKWLESAKTSSFRLQNCPNFEQFHAIAMWFWSVSRETAAMEIKKIYEPTNPLS